MNILKESGQLDWLERLVAQFPEAERPRKNLIEIAGYPSWENVNSNLLAFYLNEKEDHRMERLFLDSLLELVRENWGTGEVPEQDLFATDYTIERESDFIDILLKAEPEEDRNCPWAIIIENKIYHHLHNDLKKYWNSVEAGYKLGVVLSLYPLTGALSFEEQGREIAFVNVTHAELVGRVRQKLPEYFDRADDRHLLFLKEYFANIDAHYTMKQADTKNEESLKAVQQHKQEINKLNQTLEGLQKYVLERLEQAFREQDFEPKNTYLSKAKTYYSVQSEERRKGTGSLRFWVNVEALLMENACRMYLELCGDGVQHGEAIKAAVQKQAFPWGSRLKTGAGKGTGHFHLASLVESLPDRGSLDDGLQECIGLFFDKRVGEKSLVDICTQQLQLLLNDINKKGNGLS